MEYESKQMTYGQMSLFDLVESASGVKLHTAMIEARSNFEPLAKSGVNSYFKSGNKEHRFSTLKDIEDAITGAYTAQSLSVRHQVLAVPMNGQLSNVLRTTIEHAPSGEFVSSIIAMENAGGPQNTGSQITYYRRYNLISLLNLESDDEDDGNAAQGNKGDKAAPKTKTPSRSYEVFGLDGKVDKTFTDWNSFTKAIQPIDKFSHSEAWVTEQCKMLKEVSAWAKSQTKDQDDKVAALLGKLSDAAGKLKTEIEGQDT